MTTTVTCTTELESVNTLLDSILEAPVSSLEVSGLVDVAKARATLNEVSRTVQERGWHFNTEECYPLVRQSNGEITLPPNVLRVAVSRQFFYDGYDAAQRGSRLYWRTKHTYVFDKDLTADITFLLSWDEMPQAVRQFITMTAANTFQGRQLGSETKYKFSQAELLAAETNAVAADLNNARMNIFTDSASVLNILDRY